MTDSAATLFRGATILTMDPAIGDLARGDLLIEAGRIRAVAPSIDVGPDAGVAADVGSSMRPVAA